MTENYPDRGVSPASKARMRAAPKPEPAKGAYRPPGARGLKGGGSLASMIRAEREKDKGSAGTVRQKKPAGPKLPVGAAPEAGPSRNARRKEAAKKRKEAEALTQKYNKAAAAAMKVRAKRDEVPLWDLQTRWKLDEEVREAEEEALSLKRAAQEAQSAS